MRICKVHRLNQVGTTHNNRSCGQAVASCTLQEAAGLSETPSSRPGPGPPALAAAPEDGALLPSGPAALAVAPADGALKPLPSGPAALAVAPADGAAALKPLPSGPGTRRRRAAPGPANV